MVKHSPTFDAHIKQAARTGFEEGAPDAWFAYDESVTGRRVEIKAGALRDLVEQGYARVVPPAEIKR